MIKVGKDSVFLGNKKQKIFKRDRTQKSENVDVCPLNP